MFDMGSKGGIKALELLLLVAVAIWFAFIRSAKSTRPDFDFAYDFAMALRTNNSIAYSMSAPALHARIDRWMASHAVQDCLRETSEPFTGGGNIENGYEINFDCQISGDWYKFIVRGIVLKELETGYQVVHWGEIEEGDP